MNKILLIINPSAGEQKGTDFGDSVRDIFRGKGHQVKTYQTSGQDNFKELIVDSMRKGYKTVAIIGGDGTVSEFVNQISDLKNRPKIILLPLGTTNNFARALDSELNPDTLLKNIEEENFTEQKADVGKINNKYFISTVSIGTIPEVAWKTKADLKEEIGSLAYLFEGIKVLGDEYNYFDTEIMTENKTLHEKDVFLIVIGLSNSVFGIPIFFEEAKVNDGRLHIYVLKKGTVIDVTESIAKRILDENNNEENELSFTTSFKEIKLSANTDLNSSVDGEKGPSFPINLSILQEHLTFLFIKKE